MKVHSTNIHGNDIQLVQLVLVRTCINKGSFLTTICWKELEKLEVFNCGLYFKSARKMALSASVVNST